MMPRSPSPEDGDGSHPPSHRSAPMTTLGSTSSVSTSIGAAESMRTPGSGPSVCRFCWWVPAGLVTAAVCAFPIDGRVEGWWASLAMPSDVDQELRFLQQFGQFGSLVLVSILVCTLCRPALRRTLLDLGLAVLVTVLLDLLFKSLIGRLRPAFGHPGDVLGPWWMQGDNDTTWSQRGSTPSTHTAAAAVLATWIWVVFPRVRWLGVALTVCVATARVRFASHWPSDVLLGAATGVIGGSLVIGRLWATRLLDVLWRQLVDRTASPAWPDVAAAIRSQQHPATD